MDSSLVYISQETWNQSAKFEDAKLILETEQRFQMSEAIKGKLDIDAKILDNVHITVDECFNFICKAKFWFDRIRSSNNLPSGLTSVETEVEQLWRRVKLLGLVVEKQPQHNITIDSGITERPTVSLMLGVGSVANMRYKPFVSCKIVKQSDLSAPEFGSTDSRESGLALDPSNCKAFLRPTENGGRWTATFDFMKVMRSDHQQMETDALEYDPEQQLRGGRRKKLNRRQQDSSIPVAAEKYEFVFETKFIIENRVVQLQTKSNPFAIVSHQSELYKSSAVTLWESAFGKLAETSWAQLANKMSDLFLSLTTQSLDVGDLNYLKQLYLGDQNLSPETMISRETFASKNMPRLLRITNNSEKMERCKIFRWFYENALLVGTKGPLHNYWNGKRLIRGFITRAEAQTFLMTQEEGTFIVRFSESKLKSVTIGVFLRNKVQWIDPWNNQDLRTQSLADRIRNIESLKFLYENRGKNEEFGQFYGPNTLCGYTEAINLQAQEPANGALNAEATPSFQGPYKSDQCIVTQDYNQCTKCQFFAQLSHN